MNKKTLSISSITMINIIAIANLRSVPFSAKLGASLISYYAIAAVCFFIPTAIVTAELATAWPNKGGIYVWVREAFGELSGFITIWLQWIYNVVWYPTILAFVSANLATIIDPKLASNNLYTWLIITISFWACTAVNYYGMRLSSAISTIGAIIGTLLPMTIIIVSGILWGNHHQSHLIFNTSNMWPNLYDSNNISFLILIIFGLIGIEMSAVHADEVKDPKKSYPKAILISSVVIFVVLIASSIAVATVIDASQLSVTMGISQAIKVIFESYFIDFLSPWLIFLIIIGSLSSVATWIIGPTKGLLVASQDGCMPAYFGKTNSKGIPINILLLQAIIFTIISFCYIFIPNVDGVYEMLSILTTQLAVVVYILMFAAAIKLRLFHQQNRNGFQIIGGKFTIVLVSVIGILSSVALIIFGFKPPPDLQTSSSIYPIFMLCGFIIITLAPYFIYKYRK